YEKPLRIENIVIAICWFEIASIFLFCGCFRCRLELKGVVDARFWKVVVLSCQLFWGMRLLVISAQTLKVGNPCSSGTGLAHQWVSEGIVIYGFAILIAKS